MPRLRTRPFRFATISSTEEFQGTIIIVGVILALALFITAAAYGSICGSTNSVADAQTHLNQLFNQPGQTAEQRRQLASSLLQQRVKGIPFEIEVIGSGNSHPDELKTQLQALQATRISGQPLHLKVVRMDWGGLWSFWYPMWALIALALVSIMTFLLYADESASEPSAFLLDLPWRRVWPVLLVLFTLLPLGLPFYLASAVRLFHARVIQHETQEEPERARPRFEPDDFEDFWHRRLEEMLYDGDDPRDYLEEYAEKLKQPPINPSALYVRMRTETWRSHLKTRKHRLDSDLATVRARLKEYGTTIRDLQAQQNDLKAEQRKLAEINPDSDELPGLEQVEAEFTRLSSLSGVTEVRAVNSTQLAVTVEARTTYEGKVYDLGTWELCFGIGGMFNSRELESGVKASWRGGYPVYRGGGYGSFCFGDRQVIINQHLEKGQFLEAIEVAVNCLHSVNKTDQHHIPDAFRKVKGGKA